MITGIPEGPMGFVAFMVIVVVACLCVMSVLPTLDWLDRRRADREMRRFHDERSRRQVEAMGENHALLRDERAEADHNRTKSQ